MRTMIVKRNFFYSLAITIMGLSYSVSAYPWISKRIKKSRDPVGITYHGNFTTTSPGSPHTFSSVPLGKRSSRRLVILAVNFYRGSGSVSVNSVTIGGVPATEAVTDSGVYTTSAIYYALVPNGDTADIQVSGASTPDNMYISVHTYYRWKNLAPFATDVGTSSRPTVTSTSVTDGGVLLSTYSKSFNNTFSWSIDTGSIDVHNNVQMGSNDGNYGTGTQGNTVSGTRSVSVNFSSGGALSVAASWD